MLDRERFFAAYLGKNSRRKEAQAFQSAVADAARLPASDPRQCMGGHEFVEVLWHTAKRYANSRGTDCPSFQAHLWASADWAWLAECDLFRRIRSM